MVQIKIFEANFANSRNTIDLNKRYFCKFQPYYVTSSRSRSKSNIKMKMNKKEKDKYT